MDPYLEGELWTSFHSLFVPEIIRELTPQLRPRYIALAQKYHIVVDASESETSPESLYPDVGVTQTQTSSKSAATPVLQAPLEMDTVSPFPHKVPHLWIEILDNKNRRLVTAIEFLSPANKIGAGRKKYLRKRQRLLNSTAHLLEIDLLRHGQRLPMKDPLPPVAYFVFLSRVEKRPRTEVWPISLDQSLPKVPVPLLAGDSDAGLNLQTAFALAYDLSGFDVVIDFHQPPEFPLSSGDASWVDGRLRDAGLRK
jgi:hypothetical protein